MAKKWQLSFNDLRKWATGRTIYVDRWEYTSGHLYISVTIERLIQLTNGRQMVEFLAGDDIGDITRKCLEELALTGSAYDDEYDIRYYTAERLREDDPEAAAYILEQQ